MTSRRIKRGRARRHRVRAQPPAAVTPKASTPAPPAAASAPAPAAAAAGEEARPRPRAGGLAIAAHVASLVTGFVVLLHANRNQWFFGDEWEFLGHRGVFHADRSVWVPHTDHWSTVPILIYRALYSLYGIRTYVPYVVVLLVLHVALTHLLWQVMRKVGADMAVATGLAAVYALFGAGYENLLWAFQIGFVGAVAVGLFAVLLVNHDGRWNGRDWAAWIVSVVGLMFSGISVTMVTIAGLTVLLRRGWRQAALTVVVPAAVYVTWFVLVGHQNFGAHPHTIDDFFNYPDYIWTGLRTALEQAVGFPGSGPLLVLALAGWLLRRGGIGAGPAAPAFACALGAIVLYSVIAVGRTSLGVQQAEASRYVYIGFALVLPAIALALSELTEGAGPRNAVVVFLLLLVLVHNLGVLRTEARTQADLEQSLKVRILAAADLVSTPAIILNDHPEAAYDPDIVVADLRRMQRDGKLPALPDFSPDDRLNAAAILQYTVGQVPPAMAFGQPADDGVVGATEARDANGCIVLTPTADTTEIHVTSPQPFSVTVTTSASGDLTGFLRLFHPAVLTSEPRVDKIEAGVTMHVSVSASVDQVVLRVPASGTTTVCGVR